MKITIYNSKGGVDKSPIALNMALDTDYLIGTNETYHIYEDILDDDKFLSVDMNESFPEVGDTNIIFDLAGSISNTSKSISSAITMSDVIIVPTINELKSLLAMVNTIKEIRKLSSARIIVIATKLVKHKKDIGGDWVNCHDVLEVKEVLKNSGLNDIDVLPLKLSKVFDNIFEQKKSINELMQSGSLAKYNYKEIAKQFNNIYNILNIK